MEKLVAANSFPYLQQYRSNMSINSMVATERFRRRIEYAFTSNGVGPARIDWVQLSFKNKPMADLSELLDACCTGMDEDLDRLDMRGNVVGDP